MKPITLLIIDRSPKVRQAQAARLESSPRLEVVGTAANADEGLRLAEEFSPDVILLDAGTFSGPNRLKSMERFLGRLPVRRARVIVLTTYADEDEHKVVLEAGAGRYLVKDIDSISLIREIDAMVYEIAG